MRAPVVLWHCFFNIYVSFFILLVNGRVFRVAPIFLIFNVADIADSSATLRIKESPRFTHLTKSSFRK